LGNEWLVGIADHIFRLTGGRSPDRRDETTYLNTSTNYPGPSRVEAKEFLWEVGVKFKVRTVRSRGVREDYSKNRLWVRKARSNVGARLLA